MEDGNRNTTSPSYPSPSLSCMVAVASSSSMITPVLPVGRVRRPRKVSSSSKMTSSVISTCTTRVVTPTGKVTGNSCSGVKSDAKIDEVIDIGHNSIHFIDVGTEHAH